MSSPAPDLAPHVSPLREVWAIAWPTVLTMTSYTVMQFVDKLFLGQVSALDLAAQGNGGIWSFTPIAVLLGVLTVTNTYVSQNVGAGKPERGPRYAWATMWLSLIAWAVLLLPYAFVLEYVFDLVHLPQIRRAEAGVADGLAGAAAELADLDGLMERELRYGRILLFGALFILMGRGIHHFFFGLHRPKVVTVSAITGNLTNVVASYILIFGAAGLSVVDPERGINLHLPGIPGVPALGITGAALGTVLGTIVEVAIPYAVFLMRKDLVALGTRTTWRPALGPIRDLLRLGWPAALQWGNEIICWSIFMSTLVGLFGTHHQTAGWIALSYMHLSFMPAVGFSVAVTSLVGKYIGAGQPDVAAARARLGVKVTVGYMTVCGLLFLLFRSELVALFIGRDPDAERIIAIGAKLMICAAVFQTVDAIGIVYSGALRGAGDTIWPGVITTIYSWVFIVGGGWMMTQVRPDLESIGPWIGASVYIILVGLTMAVRFERGRWRSIRLIESAHGMALPGMPPASEADASIRDRAQEIAEEAADRQ